MPEFDDDKFIVIPTKYLDRLSMTLRGQLKYITARVRDLRIEDRKHNLDPRYYVVNQDKDYALDVLNTILLGEERKERRDGER